MVPPATGLVIDGLSKSYAGRSVLDRVSFSVDWGEFVAVVGKSGAGKTTLFRCIGGLTRPDAGRICLDGLDATRFRGSERRRIGFVFQQFNLVRRLTALENVLAGRLSYVPAWRGWLRAFPPADVRMALGLLDRVGLLTQADQRSDTLSGGQQQRVAIARVLAQQSSLIVADEPIASLDPEASADILGLLRAICRERGVAVLCSLHQHKLAEAYADRIVTIAEPGSPI